MEQNVRAAAPCGTAPDAIRRSRIGIAAIVIATVAIASTFLSSAIVISMSKRADDRASAERAAQEEEHRLRIERLHRTSESIGAASIHQITELFFTLHMQQLKALGLTEREARIAMLAATGETSGAIARRLAVSESTVKHCLGSVYRKTGTHNRQELRELIRATKERAASSTALTR